MKSIVLMIAGLIFMDRCQNNGNALMLSVRFALADFGHAARHCLKTRSQTGIIVRVGTVEPIVSTNTHERFKV